MLSRSLVTLVAEFEAALIKSALQEAGGNQAHAARLLGVQANTLHYKIKRLQRSGAWESGRCNVKTPG